MIPDRRQHDTVADDFMQNDHNDTSEDNCFRRKIKMMGVLPIAVRRTIIGKHSQTAFNNWTHQKQWGLQMPSWKQGTRGHTFCATTWLSHAPQSHTISAKFLLKLNGINWLTWLKEHQDNSAHCRVVQLESDAMLPDWQPCVSTITWTQDSNGHINLTHAGHQHEDNP